jgi:2,5-diamino-6-(ribosylamino)-4(3H)-pyrimidinone 5'-phosphate reductase
VGEALRLFPGPTTQIPVEEVYGDISFPARKQRPYVLINMVASLDGKANTGGKAGSIGSPTDRYLMRSLRSLVDAVMTGAGTLRAEKLTLAVPEDLARSRVARGLEPQPLAVVATGEGALPLEENLIGASSENLLVLLSADIPKEMRAALSARALVEVVPTTTAQAGLRLDLSDAVETLKKRYAVDVLLVEGGPTLNHALVEGGLADELFLTLAPKLLGGVGRETLTLLEGLPVPSKETAPKLISVHLSGEELFLRYTLKSSDSAREE